MPHYSNSAFLPSLISKCLAWRDNEQWLWATRWSLGRKLAVGMTSAKELAAALSVDPENAICGEGDLIPGRPFLFVSRRYRRQVETLPSRWAGAWEGVLDEPATNLFGDSNAGPLFCVSEAVDVRCASAAGRR